MRRRAMCQRLARRGIVEHAFERLHFAFAELGVKHLHSSSQAVAPRRFFEVEEASPQTLNNRFQINRQSLPNRAAESAVYTLAALCNTPDMDIERLTSLGWK